jgi:hypothetical protein
VTGERAMIYTAVILGRVPRIYSPWPNCSRFSETKDDFSDDNRQPRQILEISPRIV